jgi:hypothetical protein
MNDPTDTILAACTGVGIALCCICAFVTAWRQVEQQSRMKPSRSDGDLTSILDNAIPSASAGRRQEETPDTP